MKKILDEVYSQNLKLQNSNLTTGNFGNLSVKINNKIYIKPSGVKLKDIKFNEISIIDLEGNHLSGLKPSVDTPTHLYIYKKYEKISSIVHTHSPFATAWAQTLKNIKNYGTTHSDYSLGDILCTRQLNDFEVKKDYELNTGKVIVETIQKSRITIEETPGILVGKHGVFSWGNSSLKSLENAKAIEYIAQLAFYTYCIDPSAKKVSKFLNSFHYERKHGSNKYYGQ